MGGAGLKWWSARSACENRIRPAFRPQPCSRRTQAVKGVDQKSTGLCPRRFESCRLRAFICSGRAQEKGITRGGDRTHNLRLRKPTRFHCATRACKKRKQSWSSCWGSNPGPSPYQSDALPTELHDLASVAWLNGRALDLGSNGCRFESCRDRNPLSIPALLALAPLRQAP